VDGAAADHDYAEAGGDGGRDGGGGGGGGEKAAGGRRPRIPEHGHLPWDQLRLLQVTAL
jgi:hypothetical protein